MNIPLIEALVEGENAETIIALARTFDTGQPIEELLRTMHSHVTEALVKWRESEHYEKLKDLVERYADVRDNINLLIMEL